ncbi:MAG TPA: GNAT family N-acetyltransferase [Candidatus Saccharimonadales bacterium]|nr:GNAT family N-acetyltransferase [Candidatus Saccharimonadales bacterium]
MIQIVDAVVDDVYAIREVQKQTWFATYPNEEYGITLEDLQARFTKETEEQIENRRKIYSDPSVHIWAAKDGEKIVGFCIAKKEGDSNRIGAIYLLPDYHGQGIGKQLISKALNWLGNEKDIYVHVASYNNNAIKFYEKNGFVRTGKDAFEKSAILPSGKYIPQIEMLKKSSTLV